MGLEILYYLLNVLWLVYGFYEKLSKKIKKRKKIKASQKKRGKHNSKKRK